MYKKACSRLFWLGQVKHLLDRYSLVRICVAFIRPVLEYGDVVWGNCTKKEIDLLESVQIVAGRIITGLRCNSSRQKLYHELGWESLEYRRNKHKFTLFYKILNGLTPAYLYELVQPYLLFICPKYNNLRLVLLDYIQTIIPKNNNVDINIDLLLHGNKSFSYDLNTEIIKAVHKYILSDTHRFI
jgi:hypothetical protein